MSDYTSAPGKTIRDSDAIAYAALQELLRRAALHRITGKLHLALDTNQGGVTGVKIVTEESFKTAS